MNRRGYLSKVMLLIAFIVVGCGASGTGTTTSSANGAPTSNSEAAEEEISPDVDDDVMQVYQDFVSVEMSGVPIDLVQAAKDEGQLTFYSLVTPLFEDLKNEFSETFPFVQVDFQPLTGGPLLERFSAEARAGRHVADIVVFASITDGMAMVDEGLVQEYSVTVEDQLPESMMVPGYLLPVGAAGRTMAWNTDVIDDQDAELLSTWDGLLDASFDNARLAISDVTSGGSAQIINYYLWQEFGTTMWERIRDVGYAVFPAGTPALASVLSGDNAMALGQSEGLFIEDWRRGAPVRWTFPKPHVVQPFAQFIAAGAPNPNAAKLFQEFSMSATGQQVVVDGGAAVFIEGVESTADFAQEPWYTPLSTDPADLWDYDVTEFEEALPEMIDEWNSILGN